MSQTPITERAYVLARSGACPTIEALRIRLKKEGYMMVEDFISGRSLLSELKTLCDNSAAEVTVN